MKKLKYYLVASEHNDYKPWITSSSALACLIVLIWGLRLILPGAVTFAETFMDPADLMNRINQERSQRFINTLQTNSKLITAAQSKADDMLARSYFSHIDPDGKYVWPKIEAAGYQPFTTLGENLAMDFTTPDTLIAAWMNSPTHRANILNDKFEDQGLALSQGLYEPGHNSTLVASLFGALVKSTPVAGTQSNTKPPVSTKQVAVNPPPVSTNTKPASTTITISENAKISLTQVSGHNIVDVTVPISGGPSLVTARLKSQSITLLPQADGSFEGSFTFNISESLAGESITVEARSPSGQKITGTLPLGNLEVPQGQASDNTNPNPTPVKIPISSQTQILMLLRIIFGVISIVYLLFLLVDAFIMHRAKLDRPGLHPNPHVVIFFIIAVLNLVIGWK